MKALSEEKRKILNVETDMLQGNINRMCVCDTKEELDNMYKHAKSKIDKIYILNQQRFEDKKK